MIKRKYFLKDIEVERVVDGQKVTVKADQCFTEESTITIKLPTYAEKLKSAKEMKDTENSPELNYSVICAAIDEVDCVTIDQNEKITSFDEMSVFADAMVVMQWVTQLLTHGFVPKKKLTV